MDPRARKVQAERNRRRLPRKRSAYRWASRIAGVVATAALLGAGVAIAAMIIPDADNDVAAATPTPTPTPTPAKKAAKKKTPRKPKGPTKAQLAQRREAMAVVRSRGFTTIRKSDYDFKATLRVLLGRPVGSSAGGYRAFFFNRRMYIGNDALAPSTKLSVVRQGKVTVTLSYGVYEQDDPAGDPSGRKRVRFRLQDGVLTPLDTIPLAGARLR